MENYLKDNLNYLTSVNTSSIDTNFLYQLNKLNTEDYNTTQTEIYYQLNLLYDKLRVMEEVNEYLLTQIKTKAETASQTCEALLKDIEKSRDAIKEVAYHTIPVTMASTQSHYDRDGVSLKSALVYNNNIVNAFSIKRSIPFIMKSNTTKRVYHNNTEALSNGEVYRSYYITDESYADGIAEHLQFVFQQPIDINRIAAKPSNAALFNYKLHYQGDDIVLRDLNWENPVYAESVSLEIKTTNFKEEIFKCDASRMTADALSVLESELYKSYTNQATYSAADLDTLLGIKTLKEDYQKYLTSVESWQARRKQVVEANTQNGYSDSIPTHTIVKLPEELGVNDKTIDGAIVNATIKTDDILPSVEIVSGNTESQKRIVYMYDRIDQIYPSVERYRYDFFEPSSSNYYSLKK